MRRNDVGWLAVLDVSSPSDGHGVPERAGEGERERERERGMRPEGTESHGDCQACHEPTNLPQTWPSQTPAKTTTCQDEERWHHCTSLAWLRLNVNGTRND